MKIIVINGFLLVVVLALVTLPSNGLDVSDEFKILASDGAQDDYFGNSVSMSGETAIVGAYGDDDYSGSAYIFVRNGSSWTEQILARQPVDDSSLRLILVDQSRRAVVHQGQQLQLDLFNASGHRVGTRQLELGPQALSQAYAQITVDYRHIPTFSRLLQNYPNPFNPETWIPFELNQDSDVSLAIYDTAGRQIRHLDLGFQEAGTYLRRDQAIYWDGRTQSGEQVASGTYFYRLKTKGYVSTQKMIILK